MIFPEPIRIEWIEGSQWGQGFNVIQGPRSSGPLAWDELLGHIVELTHPKVPTTRIAMRTNAEWLRLETDRAERMRRGNRERAIPPAPPAHQEIDE